MRGPNTVGNTTLIAGNQYVQTGSKVIALEGGGTIAARSIAIREARETSRTETEHRQQPDGLALTSPVINTAQSIGKLSRLFYCDQSRKTTLAIKGWRRESRNFVEDEEIDVQHRVVGGWELSLNHREFLGDATLEGTLAYKRGTGGFGSRTAPEEEFGEGTSRLKLYTADVSLNAPFKLAEQRLRYSGLIRAQWNRAPLTPQDRFAIGGRYTVRGFDGETSLLGERGQWANLNYDFFVGAPISKPEGYPTARVRLGFNLNVSF